MMSRTPANIAICFLGHAYGASLANIKMERRRWPEKPLIAGRPGTQNIARERKEIKNSKHYFSSYTHFFFMFENGSDSKIALFVTVLL